MDLFKSFKIIIGILLILSGVTILALLFLEPDALALLFNFSIDITAENIGEVIASAAVAMVAGLFFAILMFIIGIFNLILYVVIGSLTLGLKRSKTILIIGVILTSFALFIEIRGIILVTLGGFTSIILIVRTISDMIIVGLSIYLLLQFFKTKELVPKK